MSARRHAKTITAFDIYCHGPILHLIQMRDGQDSKDFVDRPMKMDPHEIMHYFETHFVCPEEATTLEIENFLNVCFDPPGSDLDRMTPLDFQSQPRALAQCVKYNPRLLQWALELNDLWKVLGRKPRIQPGHEHRHSLLPTKHLLMVPGGRFRESYYWDTLWIVHGLLASEMFQTAQGLISNLLDFIDQYGFVPNGGRIYYLTRSQPPLLSEMVRVWYAAQVKTDSAVAHAFLSRAVPSLDIEYSFWMNTTNGHVVNIRPNGAVNYQLNRYVATSSEPRPESYREDFTLATKCDNVAIYREIIAMCESGWDFSSRWLRDAHALETSRISSIIPVDLNVFMHKFELNMVHFHQSLGQVDTSRRYQRAAEHRQRAIQDILWSESDSMWKDYDLQQQTLSPINSISNFFPLWSQSYNRETTNVTNVVKALRNSSLIQHAGVSTTATRGAGQQWDQPNAWPPLQDILIDGLLLTSDCVEAQALATELIQTWVKTCYLAFQQSGHMYEKYNAESIGQGGGGGEYVVQVGFGWSNGVILKFLSQHQEILQHLEV